MIGINKAFELAMMLEDFCLEQGDCLTCIFHVSHQQHRDDFAYEKDHSSYCLLNRSCPENWAIGCVKGEREGKDCSNCKHEDTDVCKDCRHCIEKWELKESEGENV